MTFFHARFFRLGIGGGAAIGRMEGGVFVVVSACVDDEDDVQAAAFGATATPRRGPTTAGVGGGSGKMAADGESGSARATFSARSQFSAVDCADGSTAAYTNSDATVARRSAAKRTIFSMLRLRTIS